MGHKGTSSLLAGHLLVVSNHILQLSVCPNRSRTLRAFEEHSYDCDDVPNKVVVMRNRTVTKEVSGVVRRCG